MPIPLEADPDDPADHTEPQAEPDALDALPDSAYQQIIDYWADVLSQDDEEEG